MNDEKNENDQQPYAQPYGKPWVLQIIVHYDPEQERQNN